MGGNQGIVAIIIIQNFLEKKTYMREKKTILIKKVPKMKININQKVELIAILQKKNQFLLIHLHPLIQINQICFILIQ